MLIIVGRVDKVAACVGESGDDAPDFFRGGSNLAEHFTRSGGGSATED